MKLVIGSDLHVDTHKSNDISWPDGDVLIIAGDTANSVGVAKNYYKSLNRYKKVYVTSGNHEHYSNGFLRCTIKQNEEHLRSVLPESFVLLNDETPYEDYEGFRFIGTNGWYSMNVSGDPLYNQAAIWPEYMNDHDRIWGDAPFQLEPLGLTIKAAASVSSSLDTATLPSVVITHTAPHASLLRFRPDSPTWNIGNNFYANRHMENVIEKHASKIKLWVHGHVHERNARDINGVTILTNPRGYPGENPSWSPVVWEI